MLEPPFPRLSGWIWGKNGVQPNPSNPPRSKGPLPYRARHQYGHKCDLQLKGHVRTWCLGTGTKWHYSVMASISDEWCSKVWCHYKARCYYKVWWYNYSNSANHNYLWFHSVDLGPPAKASRLPRLLVWSPRSFLWWPKWPSKQWYYY